jgi:hypothetical protein
MHGRIAQSESEKRRSEKREKIRSADGLPVNRVGFDLQWTLRKAPIARGMCMADVINNQRSWQPNGTMPTIPPKANGGGRIPSRPSSIADRNSVYPRA